MHDLSHTDEQRLLAESLGRYLAQANEFETRRQHLAAPEPERLALWPGLAELGVIGAAFDEAHGGFAGDARTVAVVLYEMGASLVVEPYLSSAVMAGRILQTCDAGLAALPGVEALIAGEWIPVLAHDAGSDPFATPLTRAQAGDAGYTLSGHVRCVVNGDVADHFLVSACLDGQPELFAVPRDCTGLAVNRYRLVDGAGAADLELTAVKLAEDARLLPAVAGGTTGLDQALSWGVLGLAAETVGILTALNKATFGYLAMRKQFGVPLASFQALQHRAADMYIAAEEAHAALDRAIVAIQAPGPSSASIAAAKVVADSAGQRIGHEAIQMHGGMGVSDELIVSHYARRLSAIRKQLGSADTHRLRYGSHG
ncbi:MAG: acyl-CoA dehydrogenase family protein [Pseudomonadota bacterium]|nr:acyl-CoA dehydrogenase family protein [Pseudomonadota bacterium]